MLEIVDRGFQLQQHVSQPAHHEGFLTEWEWLETERPGAIHDLRWQAIHVNRVSPAQAARYAELGMFLAVHPFGYLGGAPHAEGNTPFQTIRNSGAPFGGGSDGNRISVMNPWLHIYFAVTGINTDGQFIQGSIHGDQTITREEAIRMWTVNNGWFSSEEGELGVLLPGAHADLVVLNANFFNPVAVPDADIRHMSSVLTIVGGEVVYDADVLPEVLPPPLPPPPSGGGGGGGAPPPDRAPLQAKLAAAEQREEANYTVASWAALRAAKADAEAVLANPHATQAQLNAAYAALRAAYEALTTREPLESPFVDVVPTNWFHDGVMFV